MEADETDIHYAVMDEPSDLHTIVAPQKPHYGPKYQDKCCITLLSTCQLMAGIAITLSLLANVIVAPQYRFTFGWNIVFVGGYFLGAGTIGLLATCRREQSEYLGKKNISM